jgi:uncharacterized membrane protein
MLDAASGASHGIPILIGVMVWFLYRTIKGLIRAIESRPYL